MKNNNIKIGILTFHRALNYGAFLQALALKVCLSELGHNVKIIDYWPDYHVKAYSVFRWTEIRKVPFLTKIKMIIASLLKYRRAKTRSKKMELLQKKYLDITDNITYPSSKDLVNLSLDCIFYGSDQIWWKSKINNNEFDWTFWGDYISSDTKKIAYAASMGIVDLTKKDEQIIKTKLDNFSSISVREDNLQSILQKISSKEIYVVSDPTFLLSAEKWNTFIPNMLFPQKYILLFNLTRSTSALEIAKKKSKEYNMPIIEISSTILPMNYQKNCLQTLDAFEFLGYIKNADFVVTSSFHGTAFSIIFEKQFLATGMKNNAERAMTLLNELNLLNRYILDEKNIPEEKIDYAKIKQVKQKIVDKSVSFIKNSLS